MQKIHSVIGADKVNFPEENLVIEADCKKIDELMSHVYGELIKLNCPVSAESTLKPRNLMSQNALKYGTLRKIVDEIDGRIRDEIKSTYAFSLNQIEAAFFNPPMPLLGMDVALKFESASFDIEESGKCHALGRSTAAVFHAFRVLEVGIKAVAQCLSVQGLEKPGMQNWGKILEAIEASVKSIWPSERQRDHGDGELFWEVYTLMVAIKTPRNGTMHPARKYTEQEADRLLRVIGDIMMRLASRIDEAGCPKVKKPRKRKLSAPKSVGSKL